MIAIDERMYTVAEVAVIIGYRKKYVYGLISAGKLKSVRLPSPSGTGRIRIYPDSLRDYLRIPRRHRDKQLSRQAKSEIREAEARFGIKLL